MNFKKLFTAVFASVGGLGVALAAEGDASTATAYAGSVAETIVNNSGTTIQNFLTGAAPMIATIVGAGLAVWLGIAIVSLLKKAFGAGKGR